MNIIDSAIQFLNKIKSEKQVLIKFKKQNGEDRLMTCTLDFKFIPLDKKPKEVNLAQILKLVSVNGILRVFDLEKQDWRSVPYNEVEWLKIKDTIYSIKKTRTSTGGNIVR